MFTVILVVLSVIFFYAFDKYLRLINNKNGFIVLSAIPIASYILLYIISAPLIIKSFIMLGTGVALFVFSTQNKPFLFSIFLFSLGVASNGLVTTVNHGRMPVSPSAMTRALELNGQAPPVSALGRVHEYTTNSTRLAFLGDNFYFKYAGGIFSVGDVLLTLWLISAILETRLINPQ